MELFTGSDSNIIIIITAIICALFGFSMGFIAHYQNAQTSIEKKFIVNFGLILLLYIVLILGLAYYWWVQSVVISIITTLASIFVVKKKYTAVKNRIVR